MHKEPRNHLGNSLCALENPIERLKGGEGAPRIKTKNGMEVGRYCKVNSNIVVFDCNL